jgi:cytosine deaminase
VTIVANPLVNVHLQGRFDQYPKRRGMAPLKQFAHNGVNVALGHDDIMDPWYPLGIGSMIQVLFMAVHLDQWTGINELSQSFELITYNASKCWGNEKEYGIEVGKRANLLVMNAKSELDVLREVGLPLYVVKDGTIVAKNLDRRFSEVLYNGRWEKLSFF